MIFRLGLCASLLVFSLGDLHAEEIIPVEEGKEAYEAAVATYEAGDYVTAISALEQFLTDYPAGTFIDKVLFLLGEAYRQKGQPEKAIPYFERVVKDFPSSSLLPEARYRMALSYAESGLDEKALFLFDTQLQSTQDATRKSEISQRMAEIYSKRGSHLKAVKSLLQQRKVDPDHQSQIEEKITHIVERDLSERDLKDLSRSYPRDFPGDDALMRLIELYESRGEYYRQERELKRFLSAFPDHPEAGKLAVTLSRLPERIRSNRILLGVMISSKGPLAAFSERVLNGVYIAMEEASHLGDGGSVGIVVRDSEGNPVKAASLTEDLVREYRIAALIGPLLSREVQAVGKKTERLGIPLITPAAMAVHLSQAGQSVFQNSLTSVQQGRTLAEYAIGALGLKRFAILYPDDAYGKEMSTVFKEEVTRLGAEVITTASYSPEETDFGASINQIRQDDLLKYGKILPAEQTGSPPGGENYSPGFDALFIPGDAQQVALIAPQLDFHSIKGMSLLGANGWNSKDLLTIGGRYVEGGIFVDGFFIDSPSPLVRDFVKRYRARYSEDPDLFAAQAYDAAKMLLTGLQGSGKGITLLEHLSGLKDFPGVSGATSFRSENDVEKKLFLIQVRNGRFEQIR